MKSRTTVQDSGFAELFRGVKALERGSVQVGVADEQAAAYAPFVERDHSPFRDAIDAKKSGFAEVVDSALERGEAKQAMGKLAEELEAKASANIEERGLVDTGRLLESARGVAE